MSVIFSRSCEYAIQSVLFLARKRGKGSVLVREISDSLGIPHHFLSKVLQLLHRRGIVASQKGAHGGFSLNRPVEKITIADIVRAIDGDTLLKECILGFSECDSVHPCPAHKEWIEAKTILETMLNDKTVGELGEDFEKKLLYTMKKTRG